MKIIDKFLSHFQAREAASIDFSGQSVTPRQYATNYIERNYTPESLSANRNVAAILGPMIGYGRMCFMGMDHNLKPLDGGDDTKGPQIQQALAEIKRQEQRIGRVGMMSAVGTIGLIRWAALEGWTLNNVVVEWGQIQEGNWLNFSDIIALPSQSFNKSPMGLTGDRYIPDVLLPGIIYDRDEVRPRFFQSVGSKQVEIENALYLKDASIPSDTCLIKALMPDILALKEVRQDGMLTMRNIGVGRRYAQLNADDFIKMKEAGITGDAANAQKILDHAKALVEGQSTAQAELSVFGMRLEDRKVSVPINPFDIEEKLEKKIINFFFRKSVLEVQSAAVSASNAPVKALLDSQIATERETWGGKFQWLWNEWLLWNGFELKDEFQYWDWSPVDQDAIHKRNLENFRSHAINLNEYRLLEGQPALSKDPGPGGELSEYDQHIEEIQKIWGGQAEKNSLNSSNTTV